MKLGFGIIGCGMIARFHARAIADLPGAKLVGCYSSTPASADKFAAEFSCQAHHSLEQMLADPAINIVTICTPSGAHLEPCLAAAKAGKHVIVEKPLEITLKRCDQMIAACRKANVLLATIFPSRYHDSSILLKKAVEQGRFGKLTLGDAYVKWFRSQQYYDSGAWRGTWDLDGGGALMNQAIHNVDLLTWLMGPVVQVSAHTALLAHDRIAVEDVAVATLRFASGALGVIEASTAVFPGELKRIEIHGTQGTAVLREEEITRWEFAKMTSADHKLVEKMAGNTKTGGGASDPKAIGHHGHLRLFKDVAASLKKGTPLSIDGAQGRRSVEIILAIYKSAESGKAVDLPLPSDPVLKARSKRTKP